jgi:hypothetical protein
MVLRSFFALAAAGVVASCAAPAAEISVARTPRGAAVNIDGKLFTEYLIESGTKPVLWPIIGPTGKPMTRDYPFVDSKTGKRDHPHQRSLWFTHGNVNGVNFWAESGPGKIGRIKHVEFVKLGGDPANEIVTRNDWLDPDGKRVCCDRRTLRFGANADARWIDFEIEVKACDGPVVFGDTKEGGFGVRVADSMAVDAKLGGRIINSRGQVDAEAWGKPAEWIDYHGPVDGQVLGIALLNHPSSFRFPTHWHTRPYGLHAANPFGLRAFSGDQNADGSYRIPQGGTIVLRYRVLLHKGDEKAGRVAEAFDDYAKNTK